MGHFVSFIFAGIVAGSSFGDCVMLSRSARHGNIGHDEQSVGRDSSTGEFDMEPPEDIDELKLLFQELATCKNRDARQESMFSSVKERLIEKLALEKFALSSKSEFYDVHMAMFDVVSWFKSFCSSRAEGVELVTRARDFYFRHLQYLKRTYGPGAVHQLRDDFSKVIFMVCRKFFQPLLENVSEHSLHIVEDVLGFLSTFPDAAISMPKLSANLRSDIDKLRHDIMQKIVIPCVVDSLDRQHPKVTPTIAAISTFVRYAFVIDQLFAENWQNVFVSVVSGPNPMLASRKPKELARAGFEFLSQVRTEDPTLYKTHAELVKHFVRADHIKTMNKNHLIS